jgi:uncharacterized membrane protein YhaH (DUF805 family)
MNFFLTKGRITPKAFWLRFLFALVIYSIFILVLIFYLEPKNMHWKNVGHGVVRNNSFLLWYNVYTIFTKIILPIILSVFIAIQSIKRIHDTNKSGWNFLIPFYNIILVFYKEKNTKYRQNNYGLDPRSVIIEKYYKFYKCENCGYNGLTKSMEKCPECATKLEMVK